jgi:hypothetical protein
MSRLVSPKSRTASPPEEHTALGEYAERVTKYIPAEVLAAYLSINGILATVTNTGETPLRNAVYAASFALCLVFTPIYFGLVAHKNEPKMLQRIVSTIAFVVWAYNLGGVFSAYGIYIPWLGSIFLIVFSLVSGAFAPQPADR